MRTVDTHMLVHAPAASHGVLMVLVAGRVLAVAGHVARGVMASSGSVALAGVDVAGTGSVWTFCDTYQLFTKASERHHRCESKRYRF